MRKGLISVVLALALAGCVTADNKIRENLAKYCGALETAFSTYDDLLNTGVIQIDQRYRDAVQAAYVPAHRSCLDPASATTIGVVIQVAAAGVTIYRILAQIESRSAEARRELAAPQ